MSASAGPSGNQKYSLLGCVTEKEQGRDGKGWKLWKGKTDMMWVPVSALLTAQPTTGSGGEAPNFHNSRKQQSEVED